MDRQDSKKYPKILESKNTYLRIRAPEHLDIALEGLIRKVLKEQPNMDDIYTFAADYFDTLLKIREASGIKKFSTQNVCPFHYDEDADEMIKLASSFTKRGKEPKCTSKMYRTLTLKDSDIKKTRKNLARTISRKDVKINNTKDDDIRSLSRQSINIKSHSENKASETVISEITTLMNLKRSDSIPKENELNNNLDHLSCAELNCEEQEAQKTSFNWIQSADETSEDVNETKYSCVSAKNDMQLSVEKDNEIEITKDKKRFEVVDFDNTENSISSKKKLGELIAGDDNKAQEPELREPIIKKNRIAVPESTYDDKSGILISEQKEFKSVKDSAGENILVNSESQPNDVTNLNFGSVNLIQVNEEMSSEIGTYENKDDTMKKDSDKFNQTQQDQEQKAKDESNISDIKKITDYNCPSTYENITKEELKVLEENKISDDSVLSAHNILNEINTKKSLESNQNNEENIAAFTAKSLDGEKLLISEPITLHTESISNVQSFIEYEKQFSGIFKEGDKVSMIPNIESSLHEKGESESEIKDVNISDSLLTETQIINEDVHQKTSDFISINEEARPSFVYVTEKITLVAENSLPKIEDTIKVEDENVNDEDVNSSTTSNEFEFEVYSVKDPDTLISEKLDDSDIINEESSVEDVGKSMISKTEELIDAPNENKKFYDEAQLNTIDSSDLEQYKNPIIEIFQSDIVLQQNTDKSNKSRTEKESELTSEKQIETNKKCLEVRETMLDELVIRKAKDKDMKIKMKSKNIENSQTHGVDETNHFINDNIVNGEDYEKIKQMKEIELNDENKPAKTEKVPEYQNIANELIQTTKNIKEIETGEIEEDIFQVQLTTIIEAQINEKNSSDIEMKSKIEPILELVVAAGVELHKEENKELETIKLIKAATTIQSGFRRFQRRKISRRLGVLGKENIIDAPNEDPVLPEENFKSDLPVEAFTKSDIPESINLKSPFKNDDMGDKTKNLSRSVTKPVLSINSLDSINKVSLQRTKSLTTIRSGRGDFEIWNQLVLELEEAAAKIQSTYRRYKTRKKLKRENAVHLTMDSTDSIVSTSLNESQELNERSTGEFHDSIVLPIYPK